ncbi:MAG: ABC transporter permease [Treponema sp.]|jgi:peptide/nickel transport system permease protein|nr:ABC transporter permease [Treponema sp.]
MKNFLIGRIFVMLPLLFGVSIVNFALIRLAPGSPLDLMVSPTMTPAARIAMERNMGLDAPLFRQYTTWLLNALKGNWGYSYVSYRPVGALITERIPATVLLMGSALALGLLVAVPLGVLSAVKRDTLVDRAVALSGFVGVSAPNFFLGLGLVYVFSVKLKLFPSSGMFTLGAERAPLDVIRHLALPCVTLTIHIAGRFTRYVRSAMLDVLREEYLLTATAKGASLFRRVSVHAFRNALIPLITLVGLELPGLFGGAIVTEQIFSWPGIGRLTIDSILSRDYPVLMGITLMAALLTLLASLLTDILYAVADPRITYR